MTRLFVSLRLALAGLLFVTFIQRANADANTGSLYDAQPPPSDFLAEHEVRAGGASFSETDGACTPLAYVPFPVSDSLAGPLPINSLDCEAGASSRNASLSAGGGLTGELLLFPMFVLPQPSDGDLLVMSLSASTAPPREPFSGWPLAGVATAIVLIGGSSALRFRRTNRI